MVAIPNDPSNEGRALLLLAKAHVIGLRDGVGLFPTPKDVIDNPKQLHFVVLDAAQIPRALSSVDLGGLTNDYSKPAGFKPDQAVMLEQGDSPYANVIVVRQNEVHDKQYHALVAAIQSKAYRQAVLKQFPDGSAISAF